MTREEFRDYVELLRSQDEISYDVYSGLVDMIDTLEQEPCDDVVSRGVFEQVMWERDVAIEQLKELGYGFGEKLKTGHWIIISPTDMYCSECNEIEHLDTSRRFCAYCGTRMSENTTDSESGVEDK